MNITELARILRISPQELRDKLPLLGFDIGQRAIKVDQQIANKIISQWPMLQKKLQEMDQAKKAKIKPATAEAEAKKQITIPAFITVRDFAAISGLPVKKVLAELMKNSIFSSLNEKIDFETAAIIGADLGLEVILSDQLTAASQNQDDQLKQILDQETSANLEPRPPVIVVMGHVDHGKTKLLDTIRKTNVMAGEAGGITQHIGAYQITHQKKVITFIDTPGHEAFTAMRNRGAKIADIAILVVAADDGVKPQTANLEKTKQELTNQLKIVPEDWGGKIVCVPISAKENIGLNELLNMLLLTAAILEDSIRANPNAQAVGTIIESHIDKGEGPVATVLVQNGTLRIGDSLSFNNQYYGKVRALKNHLGQTIASAGPAMPAKIIGLKIAPQVGDILLVGKGEKIKIKNIKTVVAATTAQPAEQPEDDKVKKINLIIKSDVWGSGEAIEGSLAKLNNKSVKINIISKGLGNITEGDINRAEASGAQLIGFNVKIAPPIEELAREKNVSVKIYRIIYELINDIKAKVQNLIEPEVERANLGRLKVLAIFRTERQGQIIGGKILDGRVEANSLVEVMRNKQIIGTGKAVGLQIGKQDITQAETDQECGLKYEGKPIIAEGDILQFYKLQKTTKQI